MRSRAVTKSKVRSSYLQSPGTRRLVSGYGAGSHWVSNPWAQLEPPLRAAAAHVRGQAGCRGKGTVDLVGRGEPSGRRLPGGAGELVEDGHPHVLGLGLLGVHIEQGDRVGVGQVAPEIEHRVHHDRGGVAARPVAAVVEAERVVGNRDHSGDDRRDEQRDQPDPQRARHRAGAVARSSCSSHVRPPAATERPQVSSRSSSLLAEEDQERESRQAEDDEREPGVQDADRDGQREQRRQAGEWRMPEAGRQQVDGEDDQQAEDDQVGIDAGVLGRHGGEVLAIARAPATTWSARSVTDPRVGTSPAHARSRA